MMVPPSDTVESGDASLVDRTVSLVVRALAEADRETLDSLVAMSTAAKSSNGAESSLDQIVARLRLAEGIAPLRETERRLRDDLEYGLEYGLEEEKLRSLAEFAGGAGHEINNPLAVIAGRAQLLMAAEDDPARRHDLAVIRRQALRIGEMIADLMLFARPPQPNRERVDVAALLDDLVERLSDDLSCDRSQTAIALTVARRPLLAEVDGNQVAAAVAAICDNAIDACQGAGRVAIEAIEASQHPRPRENQEIGPDTRIGRAIHIRIRDNGRGIDDETRRHVFDPFYSGRSAGRGLGMGLAKAWRLINGNGGRIDVESTPGGGAVFVVVLPCV